MHLTRLWVKNFKRFEAAAFELGRFNVVVGPNNSGKSTLLQAMSLLQFCIRSTLRRRNSSFELENVSLGQEELAVIPVAEPMDLWKDRKVQKGGEHIKIEIQAELSSGASVRFPIDLSYNRFGIQPELLAGSAGDLAELNVVFVPGYVGFLPREERRTPAVRQSLTAQGRHGEIIRNILLDLRDAPESYQQFRSLVREVFPEIELIEPSFNEKTDLYIEVRYLEDGLEEEQRRRASRGLDLISAGSGFHQFLQIFSNTLAMKPTTLLLDEPDAHLFPGLQREVLRILQALVRDRKVEQVLLATHSSEVVSRVPPTQVIVVGPDPPRKLSAREDLPPLLDALGSVDNMALLGMRVCGRVIVTESREDEQILGVFLRKLWGSDRYRRFASRVVFLPLNGSPLNRDVDSITGALTAVLDPESPISLFVIADRDYLFEEDRRQRLEQGNAKPRQRWFIWERTETENYLLHPGPLLRLVRHPVPLPLLEPSESELLSLLEECLEASRSAVLRKLMNRFEEQDRKRTAATCHALAEGFLSSQWQGSNRLALCDAKEVVLPRLRDRLRQAYGVTFSNAHLASVFEPEEIDPEVKQLAAELLTFAGL
jgi:energy-coupling factor transporter ATP-binding protein EcfA2